MSAVQLVGKVQVRRRWAAILRIGIAAGLVLGVVLSIAAVGRRTATAYDRLAAATNQEDLGVLASPLGTADSIARFDGVESMTVDNLVVGSPSGQTVSYLTMVSPTEDEGRMSPRHIVEGRDADPTDPTEVVADKQFAKESGLRIGDTFDYTMMTVDQFRGPFGETPPAGPKVTLEVVGLYTQPSPMRDVEGAFATPAFDAQYGSDWATGQIFRLRLADGSDGIPAFTEQLDTLAAQIPASEHRSETAPFDIQDPEAKATPIRSATGIIVLGLAVTAGLVALVAGAALVQALARRHALDRDGRRIQRSLGFTSSDIILSSLAASALLAVVAGVVAFTVGVLTSWVGPTGSLAAVEPTPGWAPNLALLAFGALACAAVVAAVDVLTLRWSIRRRRSTRGQAARPTLLVARGRATATVGVWLSGDSGRGPTSVPVRSSTLGMVLGVTGIVAALVVGASLGRLVNTPERYGWNGSFTVADTSTVNPEMTSVVNSINTDDEVEAIAIEKNAPLEINGTPQNVDELEVTRGSFGWTWLDGQQPGTATQIAMGPRVASDLGVSIGDSVEVATRDGSSQSFVVTGLGLGPRQGESNLGNGVLIGPGGLENLGLAPDTEEMHVRVKPGVDVRAYATPFAELVEVSEQTIPSEVSNLIEIDRLPWLIAIAMAIVAVAALANLTTVAVRRRRRELGVVRAVGMTLPQVRRSVVLASGVAATRGLLVGVPLGILVGAVVWRLIATTSIVAGDPSIPVELLVLVPVTLVVVLLISLVPAWSATHRRVATDLRAE